MYHLLLFFLPVLLFASELILPDATIPIAMRDGTTLATDFYFPPNSGIKPLPCILMRSPAGRKNPYALMHLSLLKEGYVVAIQETRSAKDLEGKTLPYFSDGWGEEQDGYDTLNFLANSPYTNGKIGTVGASAMGITQLLMAPTTPPGLQAQYVSFATSDLFHHGLYEGGELCKNQVEAWLGLYARHPDVYKTIYTQPDYNSYWENFNMLPLSGQCKTPILHLGGWYDVFLKGTLDAFTHLQKEGGKGAQGKQKLVIGPWSHLWPFNPKLGEYDYPKAAMEPPFDFSPGKWFSDHLKGKSSELPNVLYYVMGPFDGAPSSGNVWKTAKTWPVPHEVKPLYFSNENTLTDEIAEIPHTFSYIYDPDKPIQTNGGRNLFLPSGPVDQRPIEDRSDLLIFTTEPLKEDLEITGNIQTILFVNTDAEDTAFSVRLTDVYPDGKSLLIADGITRLSHSKSTSQPKEITVDLASTSLVFAKGHRIRLIVSSSNYPRFEKNMNNLKRIHENPPKAIANNSLYTGTKAPSRLLLPVIIPNE